MKEWMSTRRYSGLKRDMIDEIQNEIEAAVRFTPMLKREANLPVRKNIGL